MLYQLPTGKVIEISTEQFLEMTDEELEYLIAYNYGDNLENPWFGSVLSKKDDTVSTNSSDTLPDITDISNDDKVSDLDVDYDPEG